MSIERFFRPGIVIERYVETEDELGNPVKQWETHMEISGLIDALDGDEQLSADKVTLVATHMLFCPVVDITEKDRVKYRGQTYDVKFVDNPMNYDRFLQVGLEVRR